MRNAHALAILVLALLVAAAGAWTPAFAQTPQRAHARPQAPPAADPSEPPAPKTTAPIAPPPSRLTLQGLPDRADTAPACRARCTALRVTCAAVEDDCAPQWNACLHRCTAT